MRARATIIGAAGAAVVLAGSWQLGLVVESTLASTGPTANATSPGAPSSDGIFAGSVQSTRYGNVQVQVTIAGGKISDVVALHLTDDGGRSVQISNRAAPILRSEIIAAQSTQVSNVSGATYTTRAYLSSAQAALDQAGF